MMWFNLLGLFLVLKKASSLSNVDLVVGQDYTGTLDMQNGSPDVTYDLNDTNNNVPRLYDSSRLTGVDASEADTAFFAITLNEPWLIRRVYVSWTTDTDIFDEDLTHIDFGDLNNGGSNVEIDSSEYTWGADTQGGDPYYYFEWEATGAQQANGFRTSLYTDDLRITMFFDNSVNSGALITSLFIEGVQPTSAPTGMPSMAPTTGAPTPPSQSPTVEPTPFPTTLPTFTPTNTPTIEGYYQLTPRNTSKPQSNFTWSDNVYPLSDRNGTTYSTFTIPGNEPLCVTCILAWADIDASINYVGDCELDFGIVNSQGIIIEPGEFYYCNGTWVLETSASLVSWQQTYGRLEIWEVDDFGRKYLRQFFEFQWNSSTCMWNGKECDVLPLTGDVINSAMFEWTMPKLPKDNRENPLIVVWYDLLSVPYALRPSVFDYWINLTFTEIDEGADLGLEEVVTRFQVAFWAAGALLFGFICIMVVACVFADEAILKQDYMLDTRDIRTTYIHSVTTLIAPQSELKSRSKFSMKRHGLWLFVVLGARLVYMFIFTFFFFYIVFRTINQRSFDILEKNYDRFANERDSQLTNMSALIEGYYYNETDRMEEEVEKRNFYCYVVYINETAAIFEEGLIAQYLNHSTQMQNSLDGIDLSNVTAGLYVSGSTACSINEDDGAEILSSDPYTKVIFDSNDNFVNTTLIYATDYNRSVITGPYNFTHFEQYMVSICEQTADCSGWTFVEPYDDNGTTNDAAFYFLSEIADPINSELEGLCYAMSEFDSSLYDFSSVNALANYTNYLENLYLSNYQEDVNTMYESFTSLWDSLKETTGKYDVEVVINSEATEYNTEIDLLGGVFINFTCNCLVDSSSYALLIDCPGCPQGNISNVYLEELVEFLYAYNYSNISDFLNEVSGSNNFSDYVSFDPALLEFPDIPEIDLPFDFDLPPMGFWTLIESITVTLDLILLIYRWYRTAGIVAGIVRGKDVEIRLKYLQTEVAPPRPCCDGRKCLDKCLNCILWGHDYVRNCSYNIWRFMYWVWTMLLMSILVLIILMLYIIVDGVVTVEFFTGLGAFDLLTVGLAAQRSIRNEVICTTALTYNNYTLTLLDQSRTTYADLKNEDAFDQNVDELDRVDDYNAYFCNAYTSYQAADRDILRDCGCTLSEYVSTNLSIYNESVHAIFDDDDTTYWGVNASDNLATDTDFFIEIELPPIQMTKSRQCYWEIVQIEFDWRWDSGGPEATALDVVEFEIYAKYNYSDPWVLQDLETGLYQTPNSNTDNDEELNNVGWEDVFRYILIKFKDIDTWEETLYLNEISFTGSADQDCIGCDTVQFYYWDFNAYDTYVLLCPEVTPVHGIMYRGWVRDWLTELLKKGHTPFIRAIRNIALSPFAILLVGAVSLMLVYLIAFMVEWVLIKVNLYRENPYAKVPLVHAKNSEFYNPSMHDVDNAEKHKDVTTYYGNSGTVVDDENETDGGAQTGKTNDYQYHGSGTNVEMGIAAEADGLHHTLRNKSRPPPPQAPPRGLPSVESTGPVVASDAKDKRTQEVHEFLNNIGKKQDIGTTDSVSNGYGGGGYGYNQQ